MFIEATKAIDNTNVVTKIDYPKVIHLAVYMSEDQTKNLDDNIDLGQILFEQVAKLCKGDK